MDDPRLVTAHALRLEHQTVEIVRVLRRAGLRAIVIKGPWQQAWLEPAGPVRGSVDIDLLLDRADVPVAAVALSALSFVVEPEVTPGVEHHALLLTAPGRAPVELHWTLWGTDPETTWPVLTADRTETITIGTERLEVPDEPSRCLLLALHAAHHGLGEEAPRYDLRRAIAVAPHSAWLEAYAIASSVGAVEAFAAGLDLVPEGVQLRHELGLRPQPLSERIAMNVAEAPVPGTPGFYWLGRQPSLRAKIVFIVRKAFPPAAFMRFKYPFARRGTSRLVVAYVYRALWMIRWAVPAFLAWRRARAVARESQAP